MHEEDELYLRLVQTSKFLELCTLQLRFFNKAFAHHVFASKQMAIAMCVLSGFVGIRQLNESHFSMTFICLFCHSVGLFAFIAMYNFAYRIPEYMRVIKAETLLQSQVLSNESQKLDIKLRMAAIPTNLGIKSSSFHTIGRDSTLVFIDFVYEQVVSMLLTF